MSRAIIERAFLTRKLTGGVRHCASSSPDASRQRAARNAEANAPARRTPHRPPQRTRTPGSSGTAVAHPMQRPTSRRQSPMQRMQPGKDKSQQHNNGEEAPRQTRRTEQSARRNACRTAGDKHPLKRPPRRSAHTGVPRPTRHPTQRRRASQRAQTSPASTSNAMCTTLPGFDLRVTPHRPPCRSRRHPALERHATALRRWTARLCVVLAVLVLIAPSGTGRCTAS